MLHVYNRSSSFLYFNESCVWLRPWQVYICGEGDANPLPDDPAAIEPTTAVVDVLQVRSHAWHVRTDIASHEAHL